MKHSRKLLAKLGFVSALLFQAINAFSQVTGNEIVGAWLNEEKEAKIQIYRHDEKFFGRIIWLREPNQDGKPKTDSKNPDKARHDDPIIGSVMLKDFRFDGKATWDGGTIYDARTGKTYSCYLMLHTDKTLKVRGYMGIPLFGKTNIWTRVD